MSRSSFSFNYDHENSVGDQIDLNMSTNVHDISDVVEHFRSFLLGCGYEVESVDQYLSVQGFIMDDQVQAEADKELLRLKIMRVEMLEAEVERLSELVYKDRVSLTDTRVVSSSTFLNDKYNK